MTLVLLYASPINASWQTAAVYPDSEDVVSQDSTTKVWTITTDNGDHVATAYDRLGRTTSATDPRGVVHQFTFDSAGRPLADTVSSLGSSGIVDGSVRRIGRTYDDVGRVASVASYADTSGTTVVNQVNYEYNGWGSVAREYQEHDGAVDGNTLFIEYNYEDGAAGGIARFVRLSQVTYPDGREVHYGYGQAQAVDDLMSRLATIGDGANTYAAYKYLGAGRIVVEDYEDLEVKLSYLDGSGNVTGLDRFGRVVDQLWADYGADPDATLDHYSYEYSRSGNRTARNNELHAAFDEDYTYDALDRLTDSDRADAFDQSWGLDGLGNFSAFDDDGDSQTRTANAVNEITAITGGAVTPAYDDAGNMISGPKPSAQTTRVHYIFDAWNRLVEVRADDSGEPGDLVAEYRYDGSNRRIEKVVSEGPHAQYFYNQDWQLLEERFVDGQGATLASNQYVWSARYIDAPIVRFHDANGDGDLLDATDNTRYYTGDANYNVTAVIDAATGEVVERYVYTAYGAATVYDNDWTNPAAPAADGPLYCGYFFDAETALYQVRNRYYDSGLSTFISRDPLDYMGGDSNLCRYGFNNPTLFVDPLGLSATGPCNISIYAGHGIWPLGMGEDKAAVDFGKAHDKPTDIVTGCGNYLAYVGCESAKLNAGVTDGRKIPGYPGIDGPAAADKMLGELQKALAAAEALQKKLCDNRKKFCDDGRPQRYDFTCKNMQRCDSVTISITCDPDMTVLMKTGIYQQRPFPGGPIIDKRPIPGLPTRESKSICGMSKKLDCTN